MGQYHVRLRNVRGWGEEEGGGGGGGGGGAGGGEEGRRGGGGGGGEEEEGEEGATRMTQEATALEEEDRRGEGKGRLDGCGRRRRGGICINMSQQLCDELLAGILLGPEKLAALHVRPMVIPYRYKHLLNIWS